MAVRTNADRRFRNAQQVGRGLVGGKKTEIRLLWCIDLHHPLAISARVCFPDAELSLLSLLGRTSQPSSQLHRCWYRRDGLSKPEPGLGEHIEPATRQPYGSSVLDDCGSHGCVRLQLLGLAPSCKVG